MRALDLNFSPDELREILRTELELCPEARMTDLYKLLYQAYYGPTHMDPDPLKIARNLRQELRSITFHTGQPYQDIGCGRGFFRINLIALIENKPIPFNQFSSFSDYEHKLFCAVPATKLKTLTDAILASRIEAVLDQAKWRQSWQQALPVVLEFITPLPEESAFVESLLASGDLPSHSNIYKELYAPHYRIIHFSQGAVFPCLNEPLEDNS